MIRLRSLHGSPARAQLGTHPQEELPQSVATDLRNGTEIKRGVLELDPEPGVVIRLLELPNVFFGAYRILPN